MYRLLLVCTFALMASCSSQQVNTPPPEPVDLSPANTNGIYINPTISKITGATDKQREKYGKALELMKLIINSQQFKDEVLQGPDSQKFVIRNQEGETKACENGERSTYSYNIVNSQCFTNKAVYESIINAQWEFKAHIETTWYALRCGWPFVNEIGHRGGNLVTTKQCHFKKMSAKKLAGHLIHEYLHILNFSHPKNYFNNRPLTIPYYIGDKATKMLGSLPLNVKSNY